MSVLLQARANIGRANAYRAGYFTPNVVVTLNSVDISSSVLFENPGPRISLQSNFQPGTATLSLTAGSTVVPAEGQLISIALGSGTNPIFAGQVQSVSYRMVPTKAGPVIYRDLYCVDWTRLLDRRVINAEYRHQSATEIAGHILDDWTSGFTRASVAANLPTIDDFIVENEVATAALRRLIHLIDGGGFVDPGRDVHFYGSAGDQSPRAGTAPRPLTTSLWSFLGRFSLTADLSQQRTRAIVEGKSTTTPVGTPDGSTTTSSSATVDYLIVAGGGGGGADDGGGGGAGGVIQGTDTIGVGTLAVVVGAGGAGGIYTVGVPTDGIGASGGTSSFNSHSASGGGGGGGTGIAGQAGGSGGGGSWFTSAAGGSGTSGQGFAGGAGNGTGGGGGGGASGAGSAAGADGHGSTVAGFGGPGITSSISGSSQYYAGGGGGGSTGGGTGWPSPGGISGGDGGSDSLGHGEQAGTANTGGGGGAGHGGTNGAAGGSGVVILSYQTGLLSCTGGTITTVGGRTIHTFTSTGSTNFVVSAGSVTSTAPTVTDLPLADATQIDASTGTVRIGNQVVSYTSTGGAVVAAGVNPPGTTTSADAAAGASSISLTDASQITSAPGWVAIGSQYVRFSAVGGGALTIPASGFGSLALAVKSGTQVTWLGHLNIASTIFVPALAPGTPVIQRVIVDNVSAQSATASVEGGDGIHEYVVPGTAVTVSGATSRAGAELTDFSAAIDAASWDTLDLNAVPGRTQAVTLTGLPTASLIITKTDVQFIAKNQLPRRTCEGSSVRTAALFDAVVTTS